MGDKLRENSMEELALGAAGQRGKKDKRVQMGLFRAYFRVYRPFLYLLAVNCRGQAGRGRVVEGLSMKCQRRSSGLRSTKDQGPRPPLLVSRRFLPRSM